MKRMLILFTFLTGLALMASPAFGQVDPATLHIGAGAGTTCATGCGGDPNLIGTGGTIDIYQNSGGASALNQPLFLILGVPNNAGGLFGTTGTSTVTFYNPYSGYPGNAATGSSAFATGGSSQWGMKTGTNGFFGDMSSSNVYTFLGVAGDNSNNFTNWSGADSSKDGVTATEFGIYVLALSGAQLSANGLINISGLSASLPKGTIAVAWGCETAGSSACSNGDTFSTAFTEAGLTAGTVTTPEPASVALMGTFLLGAAMLLGRKLRAFEG